MTTAIDIRPAVLAELATHNWHATAKGLRHIEVGGNARTQHRLEVRYTKGKPCIVVNRNQPGAARFPQRDSGDFNIKGIVAAVIRMHDAELDARPAREAAEAKHDAAVRLCEATKARLGDDLHGLDLDASSQAGKVEIDLRMRSYTPDQIAQLHALLATFA
jgi:hypothetical protein